MEIRVQKKRMLPLILLADISYSMVDNMDILNQAIYEMVESLKNTKSLKSEINFSIITFGGHAKIHTPLQPIEQIAFKRDLRAYSNTPLGEALREAKNIIENRELVLSDGYRPVVILLSDGLPTDSYDGELDRFIKEGRSSKSERLSLGIGDSFDREVMESFTNIAKKKVFTAEDAAGIPDFFKFVTMTVKEKSLRSNPDEVNIQDENELDINEILKGIPAPSSLDQSLGKTKKTILLTRKNDTEDLDDLFDGLE